jgi:hypothetical protein
MLRIPHYINNRLTDGGEAASVRRRRHFPETFLFLLLVLIPVRRSVNPRVIIRLEELGKLKKLMTSSGFEPETFRLVATTLTPSPPEVL